MSQSLLSLNTRGRPEIISQPPPVSSSLCLTGKNRRKLFDTQMKDDSSGTFCATKPKICKVYFLRCIRGSNSVVSDSIVSLGVRGVFIYVVNKTV